MIYIIDGNNLAGKLGILDNKDFDIELVKIIKYYFDGKIIKVFLVFDGLDVMGDKYEEGQIIIIRTPKDSYYKSADDKIVEIIGQEIKNSKDGKSSFVLITDDMELIERVNNISQEIKILKSTDFVYRIKVQYKKQEQKLLVIEDELSSEEQEKINKEMKKIFGI